MAYNLLSCERDQSYLMPPSMRDWLSEGHLAWFIVDAVGQMDLREFYAVYRSDGWGAAAYDPGMMVAILLYGYCLGVRSSRRIARALEEDVGFRVVAANRQPDFRTICRFRAEREEAFEELFVEVLRLCHEAGLVKLGVVALDGTKVAANAALATNRSHQAIEEEVRRMLAEAKAMDAEEDANYGPDRRGDELPEGLGGRTERLKRLKEAKERLQRDAEATATLRRFWLWFRSSGSKIYPSPHRQPHNVATLGLPQRWKYVVVHAVGGIFSVQATLRVPAPCLSEPPPKRSRICLHCFHSLHPSHESAQFGGGSEILGGGVSLTGGSKIANGRAGTPSVCLPARSKQGPSASAGWAGAATSLARS